MAILVENVQLRGGHLRYEGLINPMRLSILDVKDKQLPYDGKLSNRSNLKACDELNFALLDGSSSQKGEGKLLLSALIGGRMVKKNVSRLLPPLGDHGRSLNKSLRKSDEAVEKREGDDKSSTFGEAVTARSGMSDISVDTHDLLKDLQKQAEVSQIQESPTIWLFDSKEERESYDRDNEPPSAIETISLQDYLKSIKHTKEKLQIRTHMLEELKLAENVEEIDLSIYVQPTKSKPTGAIQAVGVMCATSLVIKYARRLAGILDSSTRVVNLTDVGLWLQRLASTAAIKEENIDLPEQPRRKSELEKRSDWRLPLAPEVAVLYAQDDLRQRLDMESKTQNFIRRRKAELEAAKTLIQQKAEQMADDQDMREYLATLDTSTAEAELATYDNPTVTSLGAVIDEGHGGGVDDDDGGGADHTSSFIHGILYDTGNTSSGHGGQKNKNSDKRAKANLSWGNSGRERIRNGMLVSERSFLSAFDVAGSEGSRVHCPGGVACANSDCTGSSASSSSARRGRAASVACELTWHKSASAHSDFADAYAGASEVEDNCWPEIEQKLVRSVGVLTDSEMRVPADNGAVELTLMRKEMVKLKRQLRFWRARSWITEHRALLATKPAKTVTSFLTEMDLRTMPCQKETEANIMVPDRRVQEFLVPKIPLNLLNNQCTRSNRHILSSRLESKSGISLKYSGWRGKKAKSSYASPRLALRSLEVIGKSPGRVPYLHSLEPTK